MVGIYGIFPCGTLLSSVFPFSCNVVQHFFGFCSFCIEFHDLCLFLLNDSIVVLP